MVSTDNGDWVGFQTFRHACAWMLTERGRKAKQVAEWLWRADRAFTQRTMRIYLIGASRCGLFSRICASALLGSLRSIPLECH